VSNFPAKCQDFFPLNINSNGSMIGVYVSELTVGG
jgi:hypothetical protein